MLPEFSTQEALIFVNVKGKLQGFASCFFILLGLMFLILGVLRGFNKANDVKNKCN